MTPMQFSFQVDPRFFSTFMANDPLLFSVQIGLLALGFLLVYLVFFTTRDCLVRSSSFLFTCFSILLVSLLPFVGFLLYLLIRPSTTVHDREMMRTLKQVNEQLKRQHQKHDQKHDNKHEKKDTKKS